jgi:hypothetical protein
MVIKLVTQIHCRAYGHWSERASVPIEHTSLPPC